MKDKPSFLSGNAQADAGLAHAAAHQAVKSAASVVQLVFQDVASLHAAYITVFSDGGIFVPSTKPYQLGDELHLMLSLPDDGRRLPIAGKVAWITPAQAGAGRTQGVGVRFAADSKAQQVRMAIENALGAMMASTRPTQTV